MEETQTMQQATAPPNTRAMVQKLQETRDMGVDTLSKLSEQSETLDRINSLNDEQKDTLKGADWMMKKLSVRGRIATFFSKKPDVWKDKTKVSKHEKKNDKAAHKMAAEQPLPQQDDPSHAHKDDKHTNNKKKRSSKEKPQEPLTEEDLIWHPELRGTHKVASTARPLADPDNPTEEEILEGMTEEQRQMIREQDEDLDAMASLIGDLKQISIRTGTELNSQSRKIDEIDTKVEMNNYALRQTNIRLHERLH